ncbi:hypothetical protein [Paraburkholderia acidisoli]|uniref:Lipoprotein n=1 Tax=Paraburkholderia acidisoli TaxID=2571748 RepID=A0A7Z2JE17_9BURK|nr:hypothetical protein [Paraburkholderia acidisoli]QGZ61176.1 hypothetical protein FAZ98_05210 [Paraburkholderia acidisoli]
MNKRNACLAALAAATTLLAGCAAQYRNMNACEEEMRNRLAAMPVNDFAVSHRATTYRGARVVVEGSLEGTPFADAASGASGASGAEAASAASGASSVSAHSGARRAAEDSTLSQPATGLPGFTGVPTTHSANSTDGADSASDAKPTTPVGVIAQKLGIGKAKRTPTAAECTFGDAGNIVSFRWLAPDKLAKTTPDPNADSDDE